MWPNLNGDTRLLKNLVACKTAFAGFRQGNQPTVDHFTGIIRDTYSMEKVYMKRRMEKTPSCEIVTQNKHTLILTLSICAQTKPVFLLYLL